MFLGERWPDNGAAAAPDFRDRDAWQRAWEKYTAGNEKVVCHADLMLRWRFTRSSDCPSFGVKIWAR